MLHCDRTMTDQLKREMKALYAIARADHADDHCIVGPLQTRLNPLPPGNPQLTFLIISCRRSGELNRSLAVADDGPNARKAGRVRDLVIDWLRRLERGIVIHDCFDYSQQDAEHLALDLWPDAIEQPQDPRGVPAWRQSTGRWSME